MQSFLKGAALRQPPLPQSGPRAKTIAHPCTIRSLSWIKASDVHAVQRLRIFGALLLLPTFLNVLELN
jgi:hypothetical protein